MKVLLIFWALLAAFPVLAGPVVSEFMASNETVLADEDGEFSDWIEIHNPGEEAVDLGGYFLTDDAAVPEKWVFPPTVLGAGEYLVVFASGKDRDVGELHTNFRLAAAGEYLGLVGPDGVTVVADFGALYPPQFADESYGVGDFGEGYLEGATPGMANGGGRLAGPLFVEYRTGGARPAVAEDVVVTARVEGAEDVTLFYRKAFGPEVALAMTTGDGENFTATIPGTRAGELIRWRFVAQDLQGRVSKEPPFRDPEDSHEYYGVPVLNTGAASAEETAEWFITIADYDRLTSFQRVRGGFYFLGEYYDNVRFSPRGQSTLFFEKTGFGLDFNKTQRFRWREGGKRVRDIDLLTNWGDKSKVRNELAYEILREAGVPTHFAFTVRLQRNGQFFSLTDMVEDADELYLERAGLPEDGGLYKADRLSLTLDEIGVPGTVRKMTREDEGFGELADLIRGVNEEDFEKWNYIFDHVDLPMTINTLAGLATIMQTDMGEKNYYLFQDQEGDGQWAILPWDLDLTFGRNFTARAGYFDQTLFYDRYTEFAELPNPSVLVDALLRGNPRTRAMYFRRLRTLSDRFLASDELSDRMTEKLLRLESSAFLDSNAWGYWNDADPVPKVWDPSDSDAEFMAEAVARIREEWLPRRRLEIYENTPDLPAALGRQAVRFGALDFDPISDDQNQEFVELINQSPTAVDLSGWRVAGAVRMTLAAGTVVPAGGSVFLSPDLVAFRSRDLSPTGGEQRFVVGPYAGNLAAEGETLELYNERDELQDSLTFSGRNPGFNGDSRVDADGDGLNALLEWALGSSDGVFNGLGAPSVGEFRYTVQADLNGFEVVIETSEDLSEWSQVALTEVSRVTGAGGVDEVVVALPESGGRGFVRLRVRRVGDF